MHRKSRIVCSTLAMLVVLSGCTFQQAGQINSQASDAIAGNSIAPAPVVETSDAPFLLGDSVKVAAPTPPELDQPITLITGRPEPLREIAAQIAQKTGLAVDVNLLSGGSDETQVSSAPSEGVAGLPPPPASFFGGAAGTPSSEPSITVRYSGPLNGLLDTVTAQAGMSWRDDAGAIKIFDVESQTFVIPALDWVTKATNQIAASSGSSTSSGDSGGMSGGMSGQSGGSSTGSTNVTTTTQTDIWKGIEADAKVVAGNARISADPQTATLTVLGTPDQIQQVGDWVQTLSTDLIKTVAIQVHVYNVQLTTEDNFGVNPTLAFQNSAKSLGINVSGASMPAVLGTATPFKFGASILSSATGSASEFSGTAGAFQALSTLGKVTEVISASATTLNNQSATLQNAVDTGYLGSSQTSIASNVGTLSSLQPADVTTGFTGTVKPLVFNNKILLGMNINLGNLLALITEASGGSSIQVPTTAKIVIDQSASLQNGATLMITGYQEADTNTTHNGVGSPFMPLLGGGGDSQVKKNLIAIVITAGTI